MAHLRLEPEYLSARGVAKYLGVGLQTVWALLHAEQDPLPHFRIRSRIIRVKKTDLESWLQQRRGL
jgi:excisionase family DNA binding protein